MNVAIVFVSEDGGNIISTMSWSPCPQLGPDEIISFTCDMSVSLTGRGITDGVGYITVSVLWAFIQYILSWESKVLFRGKIYCWLLNFSFQQLSAQSTEIILLLQHYILSRDNISLILSYNSKGKFKFHGQFAVCTSKLESNKVYENKYFFLGSGKIVGQTQSRPSMKLV